MRFPGFYGNPSIRSRLSAALKNDRLSSFYILIGPSGSGKKTLGKILAAAMLCTGSDDRPCGVCPACRKIFGGGHLDVITIEDTSHVYLPVERIRTMRQDAFLRPNEGSRKVYLIPHAEAMQAPAQNALLKILEEPPDYCSFILMTDTADHLLSTIRSRGVELELFPIPTNELISILEREFPKHSRREISAAVEQSNGYLGPASALLQNPDSGRDETLHMLTSATASGGKTVLLEALVALERLQRAELLQLLQQYYAVCGNALRLLHDPKFPVSADTKALAEGCSDAAQLYQISESVQQAMAMLRLNVSVGHVVGYLMASFFYS